MIRCENCERDRLREDVFWHEADSAWYCVEVLACEARLEAQARRGLIDFSRRPSKPGVSV